MLWRVKGISIQHMYALNLKPFQGDTSVEICKEELLLFSRGSVQC